jgi:hypothetical protein
MPLNVKLVKLRRKDSDGVYRQYTKKLQPEDVVIVKTKKDTAKVDWEVSNTNPNKYYDVQSAPLSGSSFSLGDTPVKILITNSKGRGKIFRFTVRVIN